MLYFVHEQCNVIWLAIFFVELVILPVSSVFILRGSKHPFTGIKCPPFQSCTSSNLRQWFASFIIACRCLMLGDLWFEMIYFSSDFLKDNCSQVRNFMWSGFRTGSTFVGDTLADVGGRFGVVQNFGVMHGVGVGRSVHEGATPPFSGDGGREGVGSISRHCPTNINGLHCTTIYSNCLLPARHHCHHTPPLSPTLSTPLPVSAQSTLTCSLRLAAVTLPSGTVLVTPWPLPE